MSCFGISIGTSGEKVSLSRAISTTRNSRYSVSSRPRIKVTIRPSRLTADTIPRTLGTPNFSFKIGRTKTPKVAPSLAMPAANPPAVPRNCVGNSIGASVNVVELGPAFISKLNRMNPAKTSGMCKPALVRPTAATNTNMPTAMPAKPIACIRMRPNRGTDQIPSRKPNSKNKSIMALPSARAKSCAFNPRVLPEISMAPRIVGVNNPTPYVAISIRNQGIVTSTVRAR